MKPVNRYRIRLHKAQASINHKYLNSLSDVNRDNSGPLFIGIILSQIYTHFLDAFIPYYVKKHNEKNLK